MMKEEEETGKRVRVEEMMGRYGLIGGGEEEKRD